MPRFRLHPTQSPSISALRMRPSIPWRISSSLSRICPRSQVPEDHLDAHLSLAHSYRTALQPLPEEPEEDTKAKDPEKATSVTPLEPDQDYEKLLHIKAAEITYDFDMPQLTKEGEISVRMVF